MDNKIIDLLIKNIVIDNNSLEELYILVKPAVYSFSLTLLNNKEEAEDVTQDTFVNIHKYCHQYSSQDKPMAWILTITKNICYQRNKKSNLVDNNIDQFENILKTIPNHDDKIFIETILNSLNNDEKQILFLHDISGFKYHEISKFLDLKLSTVLSKYHRALKKIKQNYQKEVN